MVRSDACHNNIINLFWLSLFAVLPVGSILRCSLKIFEEE